MSDALLCMILGAALLPRSSSSSLSPSSSLLEYSSPSGPRYVFSSRPSPSACCFFWDARCASGPDDAMRLALDRFLYAFFRSNSYPLSSVVIFEFFLDRLPGWLPGGGGVMALRLRLP
ncbi:MAG: hypothetical protein IMZ46_13955 [Acidobacteria bacterium]|nr:hypothetical protein [Acidobacteriota bacterium]